MRLLLIFSLLLFGFSQAAHATASTSQDAAGNVQYVFDGASSIKIAPAGTVVNQACAAVSAGAIRYNRTTKTVEGCNGALWGSVGSSTPSGAVMAFNLARCPAGWSAIPALSGRTVVGAGAGAGLTVRRLGEVGGEETHTITVQEMPAHQHIGTLGTIDLFGTLETTGHGTYNGYDGRTRQTDLTSSVGNSQPHNVMQPYMALLYCQKD